MSLSMKPKSTYDEVEHLATRMAAGVAVEYRELLIYTAGHRDVFVVSDLGGASFAFPGLPDERVPYAAATMIVGMYDQIIEDLRAHHCNYYQWGGRDRRAKA